MPNGALAEALAVPIKPTLPPRPSVSGLPRVREKAAVGPEQAEYPEDIITGQPITQELSEAWMDLQNYVGSMWTTYGINIQKPDPSSPAQGEAHRRYIEKLNKVQTLGATAKRAKELQEHKITGRLRGSFGSVIPGLEGEQLLITDEFDDIIRDQKGARHNFFSRGEFKKAEELKNQQIKYFNDRLDYSVERGLPPEAAEFAKKEYTLRLTNNYMDEKSRAQMRLAQTKEARAAKGKEFPAFDELHRTIKEEFNPAIYTEREELDITLKDLPKQYQQKLPLFSGQPVKRTGFLIGTTLFPEEIGQRKFDDKMVRGVVTPKVEAQVLSKDGKHIYLIFDDESTQVMTLKELEKRHINYSGKYGTSEAGKLRGALAKFYKGEAPTAKKEEVPTKKKITENFSATNAEGKTIISDDGKIWYDKETMEKIK